MENNSPSTDGELCLHPSGCFGVAALLESIRKREEPKLIWAIVDADALGHATLPRDLLERPHVTIAGQPLTRPDRSSLTVKASC